MRFLRWLLIVLLALGLGQHPGAEKRSGGGAFRELIIESHVSDNLALFFHQFETELVLCLEGEQRGPDLYVTDFRVPHILVSESGRVQAAACKSNDRTVGTWHNHPAPRLSLSARNPESLARNCYLSRTDIADFQRRQTARVTVVACAPRIYAYWKRDDVSTAAEDVALLPPPEGQLIRAELADSSNASDLTQARTR